MKEKNTNVLDYLEWRGDLSFEQDKFNEIDACILARFSYLSLKNIVDMSGTKVSIKDAYAKYDETKDSRAVYWKDDPALFKLMSESNRFKDLNLLYHVTKNNDDEMEQFSAITIELNENSYYLSFRGTDNTINGWKEDLLMSFDDKVSSQQDALDYIQQVSSLIKGDIYIGGHSKGGNLSIYTSLFCNSDAANRIKGVYSFDGPGLHKNVLKEIKNTDVIPTIINYIPQSSIFGKMLSHKEQSITVYSDATGALQHDIYSWTVMQKSFNHLPSETATSRIFDQAFHDYLDHLSKKEREDVVEIVFEIVDSCDAKTMDDLTKHLLTSFPKIMGKLSHLDDEEGKALKEAFIVLESSFKQGIEEEVKNYLSQDEEKQ